MAYGWAQRFWRAYAQLLKKLPIPRTNWVATYTSADSCWEFADQQSPSMGLTCGRVEPGDVRRSQKARETNVGPQKSREVNARSQKACEVRMRAEHEADGAELRAVNGTTAPVSHVGRPETRAQYSVHKRRSSRGNSDPAV
ncbi:hypothetical protein GCM10023257_16360 [Streptomyces hyderabadensis]|uniref:Transposase n=1 Tax=Streptomyces hyderabadensis TaxID=598549 RepID=A0ABP9HV00_9ACTN